jgi:hypothetical protein
VITVSLLDKQMETFCFIDKTRESDGESGYITVWKEGAEFTANARFDTSMQARIGEAQGVTALYTVTTRKAITLEYHDVIKRLKDGKIFRITSDGDDVKTPDGAGLNMRQVTAEEWRLPND